MITKSKLRSLQALFSRLAAEEDGTELVEWVLVVGVIAALCIFTMTQFGNTLALRWNETINAM